MTSSPIVVPLSFFTRRQNTGPGYSQYRIWAPRSEAERLAEFLPDLASALAADKTFTWPLTIVWNNGSCPKKMAFGTYHDQSGELAFTASKDTYLFDFARDAQPSTRIESVYEIRRGLSDRLKLNLTLP
ncbi:hypothetical protein [Nannocystis pusilla]|uniref:hypothetical protein n=1 Tax=Nannocystis pusilla TaxID=889268 RepID=UPI003DA6272C